MFVEQKTWISHARATPGGAGRAGGAVAAGSRFRGCLCTDAIGASNDLVRTSGTGYYTTSDSGRTWFAADLPLGTSSCCDPGIAYAFDGTAYFINLDTSPAAFHVMKSIDNGATWHSVADVSPGDDRDNIVVDNGTTSPHKGRIFVTYTDFGTTNEIRLFYSDNQGASWTGPINVSHTGSSGAAY